MRRSSVVLIPATCPGLLFLALFAAIPAQPQSSIPVISAGGIVNSSDYTQAIAPGSLIAIYGQRLAPVTRVAPKLPLPLELETVSVILTHENSAYRAPLVFVSANQVNAQVPYEVMGAGVSLRVRTAAGTSAPVTFNVTKRAPRLFTKTMDGRGEAIAMHANFGLISATSPAKPGETIILYANGLGAVNPPLAAGMPSGDGGGNGALRWVTAPVQVTVNGAAAGVGFWGLAPYFAGVYQLNITLPNVLAQGPNAIVVTAEGQSSQSGVSIASTLGGSVAGSPEDVLEAALVAQTRGDVPGMLDRCTTEFHSSAATAAALEVLEIVRRRVTFRDFQFLHRATSYSTDGEWAFVRGEVSYLLGVNGSERPTTAGVLAFMAKRPAGWKVVNVNPDDALNQEIHYREYGAAATARTGYRQAEALGLVAMNKAVDQVMNDKNFNAAKLGLEGAAAAIGTIPIAGDAAAQIYQGLNTAWEANELVQELSRNGCTPIALLKAQQVAAGALQIVTEAVPVVDSVADAWAAGVDQYAYNAEMKRAMFDIKKALANTQVAFNPQFEVANETWTAPAGMDIETEQPRYPFHSGLARIILNKPHLGVRVPFRIIGALFIPDGSNMQAGAERLGAVRVGSDMYLPLDLTLSVVSDEPPVNEKHYDPILQHMQREMRGATPVLSWEVTCSRGEQRLFALIQNGERARGPLVQPDAMNFLEGLTLRDSSGHQLAAGDKIQLAVGQARSYRALGLLPDSAQPETTVDLTASSCLTVETGNGLIASSSRGQDLGVKGVSSGQTQLNLTLAGGKSSPSEIRARVPIVVELNRLEQWLQSINWLVEMKISANLYCKFPGEEGSHSCSWGTFINNKHYTSGNVLHAVTWDGLKFTVKGTHNEISPSAPVDYEMSGTVSPDGSKILNASFRIDATVPGAASEVVSTEVSFSGLPRQGKDPAPALDPNGNYQAKQPYWILRGPGINALITGLSYKRTRSGKITEELHRADFESDSILSVGFGEVQ